MLKVKGFEIYESMDEMPIVNWNKFQKYQLMASGIGSSINDFDVRASSAYAFVQAKQNEKAKAELDNMRQLFWHLTNEINVKSMSFACMVNTGKPCTESELERTVKEIEAAGLTNEEVTKAVMEVKKKLKAS